MTALRGRFKAFSLVELSLAFLIVALAIVPVLSLFFGTSRLANKSTGVLREAVAGQMLWEVIKYRAAINPSWLGSVTPVQEGAFVSADGPLDASGQPLPLSPLTEYLFNRGGGAMYQAGNEDSLSGAQGLAHTFADLAFRVTILDGNLPAWKPADATPTGARETLEQVKDVSIEVFRVGPDRRLNEPAAFRLDSELVTPADSLSLKALQALENTQDNYDYVKDLQSAYASMGPLVDAAGLPVPAGVAGANLALIAIESVGETILTEGHDLGFHVPNGDTGQGTHYQLDLLKNITGKFGKWMKADLNLEEARGIMAAYRRTIVPIHELEQYMDGLNGRLGSILDSLKKYQANNLGAQRGLETTEQAHVSEGLFWRQLFLTQTKWLAALERPEVYPGRYRACLDQALAYYKDVEDDPEAWPMERVWALNAYLEVEKALKLLQQQQTLAGEALIERRQVDYRDMHRPYSEALAADDFRSLPALSQRNQTFAELSARLPQITMPDSGYEKLMAFIRPDGSLTKALNSIQANTLTGMFDPVRRLDAALSQFVVLHPSGMALSPGQVPTLDMGALLTGEH